MKLSIFLMRYGQYNIFLLIFSWFALANIWLTFSIIIDLLPGQGIILFGTTTIVRIITQYDDILTNTIYRLIGLISHSSGYILRSLLSNSFLLLAIDLKVKERLTRSRFGFMLSWPYTSSYALLH